MTCAAHQWQQGFIAKVLASASIADGSGAERTLFYKCSC